MAEQFYPMGPGILLCGDPSSAASMKRITDVEDFNFSIGARTAFATTADTAGAPVAEGIYALPPNPSAAIRINDAGLDNLEVMLTQMGGAKTVTGTAPADKIALGFGGDTVKLGLLTWCFIPVPQKAAGVAAKNAIWMPRAFIEGLDGIMFNRLQQGSSNNAYNVTLKVARGKTDAKATTPNAIPEKYQYGWIGDPSALGLTYALPTL